MPTIYPDEVFDDDRESLTSGSRLNPGDAQKSSIHFPSAGIDRRRASPREVDRRAGKQPAGPGLTPKQWLAQWCRLDEQT